jgi:hypothetical protein
MVRYQRFKQKYKEGIKNDCAEISIVGEKRFAWAKGISVSFDGRRISASF